jgi:nucleoside-diphosphate-sugar epimerase
MATGAAQHVILGTGPIGMAVMDALLARGARVRMVNRGGRADIPAAVELVSGDLSDPATARAVCAGASAVYVCLNPPYHRWPELWPPLLASVIEGAADAGAKLVMADNLYMYGPTGGQPLREDTPVRPAGDKGRTRALMADMLLDAHAGGRVRVTIARAFDYFGPRGLGSWMGDRVFYPALEGKPAQTMGDPDASHTYTYLPDLASGLVMLAGRPEADGEVWHLPAAETLTTRAFIGRVYAETGHEPRITVLPKALITVLGLFNPMVRELRETHYQFAEPFVLDDAKFKAAFGDLSTPLSQAIPATVDWYRAHPQP